MKRLDDDDIYMILMVAMELHGIGVNSNDIPSLIIKSHFFEMLKSDPEITCHYDAGYWAYMIIDKV